MISADQIKKFSKQFAIDEYTVIREYLQVLFLSILYEKKESQYIYFKGGTCIRLMLQSGRFSEDLDFTADLGATSLEAIVNETIAGMNLVVSDLRLKNVSANQHAYTGILSYKPTEMKHPLNINLDFSLREKPETGESAILMTDFPITPLPVVRCLNGVEILAEKIRALLYRSKGRDVYDLWFLLQKGVVLNWPMINRKTKMYNLKTSLRGLVQHVADFDEKLLKNDLGKFLPAHDRGLVVRLKDMTLKQLLARLSFAIAASENLDYTKVPGHSFSGTDKFLELEDIKTAKITDIKRQDENSVTVKMMSQSGTEATAYVRARSRNGVRELGIIEKNKSLFKNKSYDELINHDFTD